MAEPTSPDAPLPFAEAVDLLRAFRAGTAGDHLIPDPPLLLVELEEDPGDHGEMADTLRPPTQFPCIVAALTPPGAPPPGGPPPAGADLYLTAAADPPKPWVTCRDRDSVIAATRANPQASTVLAQVLRAHTANVEHDLITESLAYGALQAGSEHRTWLEANRDRHLPDRHEPPAVRVSRSAETLEVVLDRPARRNAYSARMRDELVAAMQLASSDPTITAVHLRGEGPDFCSGGDLAEFGTVDDPATAHRIRMTRNAGFNAHLVERKLTAHVHGSCVGAGVELPAFAGQVCAAEGATFRLPEVGMGLIPGAGGTASIPRRIGTARTAWLALTGIGLDARTALRWGLVDSVEAG